MVKIKKLHEDKLSKGNGFHVFMHQGTQHRVTLLDLKENWAKWAAPNSPIAFMYENVKELQEAIKKNKGSIKKPTAPKLDMRTQRRGNAFSHREKIEKMKRKILRNHKRKADQFVERMKLVKQAEEAEAKALKEARALAAEKKKTKKLDEELKKKNAPS